MGGQLLLSEKPSTTTAAMYAHNDLKSGGPKYPIPAADTICGVSGVSRSMYSLNKKCGWEKGWTTSAGMSTPVRG